MPQPVDPSFKNAASLAAQGAATRRLDASLVKLAAATAVKPAESKPGDVGDSASLTQTNVLKAVRDTAPLRELGSRLIDLRRILASPRQAGAPNDFQSKIDASLAAIRKVAESLRGGQPEDPLSPATPPPNAIATNVDAGVSNIQINAPDLAPGESLDVNVLVAQSAQTASLMLSFGAGSIDLGAGVNDPNARFTLEISGPLGVREFSFTSGTSLRDVADTFNSFTEVLGLSATVSGRAVRLDSIERNADAFVSVRVVDDGGIAGNNIGIYRYEPTDGDTADWRTRVGFDEAEGKTLTDFGQDLVAFVNGAQATNTGDTAISVDVGRLKVAFDLTIARAQSGPTFPFRAFTIVGEGESSAVDRVAALDRKSALNLESLALLDDAIREVEQAERERLLGRAGEPLSIDEADIPVIREAQARLLDEARRLGLLIDHDPAKTFDALRG